MRRYKVDTHAEEQLLIGLIVSTKFCKEIIPIVDKEYLQTEYAKKIVEWASDYFKHYEVAPGKHIQELYNFNKENLKEAEADNISMFLSKLSDYYESEKEFNADYFIDKALEYLREQAMRVLTSKSRFLLDAGKLDEAEEVIREYKKVAKNTANWVNPFDKAFIKQTFLEDKESLFIFPGALGSIMGGLERGWLVGILGPMKRGKTWYLQEFAVFALYNRLNVIFISLEMDEKRLAKRLYKRFTAFGEKEKDIYLYPVFDCKSNQDDSCSLPERTNRVKLLNESGEKPPFSQDLNYRVCVACRGKMGKPFKPESWFDRRKRDKLKLKGVLKKIQGAEKLFGSNLRVFSYPAYSANMDKVRRDIEKIEYVDGFIPDLVILDYADILAPEDTTKEGREKVDETWKMLKNLSQSKHCLVVTASQSNRASIAKKNVTQTDTAEDIRKIAHVDMMISLNQLPEEKRDGVMRIAVIAHREKQFDQLSQCMVLQQLELGQPHLDSEMINSYRDANELREKIEAGEFF